MSPSPTWITPLGLGTGGLRVAVKDLLDVAGIPTTAGCRAVAERATPAETDAACLTGLRHAISSGHARLVGKTNLDELAAGISGINPWFGTPVNPLDPALVPGGSSSGSAVAVGSREADVAIGTDTGGSVRIPAACCGIAGLKTTFGRLPTEGLWPLAPSLDTIGPLARDVDGLVAGMRLLDPSFAAEGASPAPPLGSPAGRMYDGPTHGSPTQDSQTHDGPTHGSPTQDSQTHGSPTHGSQTHDGRMYDGPTPVGRLRAQAPDGSPLRAGAEIEAALDAALAAAGFEVLDVALPGWAEAAAAALHLIGAEAAEANRALVRDHAAGVSDEVREVVRAGARIGHQQLLSARGLARRWARRWDEEVFSRVAALALPVLDGLPPRLDGDVASSLTLRWTAPVNLAGLPALALPVPIAHAPLPTSLQLVGPAFSETTLLSLGARIEAAVRAA